MQLVPGSSRDKYRLVAIALIALVTVASTSIAIMLGQRAADVIRGELGERSQSIAAALNSDEIIRLSGTKKDENLLVYKDLKARLAEIKKANASARSLYLTGERNGRLFFYVDSEKPDSRDYSPAGEYYDDATPEFKGMFTKGAALVEGPVTDDFGTFISGLAPIFRTGSHEVIAVIGIDVAATTYYRAIFLASFTPVLTGLILILIIVIFEWLRRRNQQMMTLRSELISVASHELRTPIVAIRMAAESLEHSVTQQPAATMVHAIYDSARRLQTSTDDILELTRAMKQAKLTIAPVNIIALFAEVIALQELAASQKRITVTYDPFWPTTLTVNCDADKIKRALHNIISNAIKYTHEDTTVTLTYRLDEKNHLFFVTDQGIGIPKTEQTKVFGGLYRASNAVASKVPGTGLGLFLVKSVFEQHGGWVSCKSEENNGTTFTLALPNKT